MFAFYNRHSNTFYNNLIKLSRNIFFYKELKLQDNFDTRAILILLHLSIVIIAVKDSGPDPSTEGRESRKSRTAPQKSHRHYGQELRVPLPPWICAAGE